MEGNTGHYGSRKGFVGIAKGESDDLWVRGEVLGHCFDGRRRPRNDHVARGGVTGGVLL